MIAQVSGEAPTGVGDELRLTEDLHLDSLGRVQLAAAIEERLGMVPQSGLLEEMQTLGELRQFVAGEDLERAQHCLRRQSIRQTGRILRVQAAVESTAQLLTSSRSRIFRASRARAAFICLPSLAWLLPFRWLRSAFVEAVMRPLVWMLAHPAVVAPHELTADEPMLIVANHVTTYDGPFIQYALPGPIRRHMAVAMSGEMLEDFRHFRDPDNGRFSPSSALPLICLSQRSSTSFHSPGSANFQPSFVHAGKAMDHGFNVLVFPEARALLKVRWRASVPGSDCW